MRRLPLVLLVACGPPDWPAEAPSPRCEAGAVGPEHRLVVPWKGAAYAATVRTPASPGPHDMVVDLDGDPAWIAAAAEAEAVLLQPVLDRSAGWWGGPAVDPEALLDAMVGAVDRIGCTSGRVIVAGSGPAADRAEAWACVSDAPDAVLSRDGAGPATCQRDRPIPRLHHGAPGEDTALERWLTRNGPGAGPVHEELDGRSCDTWTGAARTASCSGEDPLVREGIAWVRDGWARMPSLRRVPARKQRSDVP